MSYDDWKTRVPDTDVCTDEPETCECPECRTWRDNREAADADGEDYCRDRDAEYRDSQIEAQKLK